MYFPFLQIPRLLHTAVFFSLALTIIASTTTSQVAMAQTNSSELAPSNKETWQAIKIATTHFPPYFIANELKENSEQADQNENPGFLYESIDMIMRNAGFSATFKYLPLARAKYFVQSATLDCISPIRALDKQNDKLIYSDPLPGGPVIIMGRNGSSSQITKLTDLERYHIGTVIGDQSTLMLTEKSKGGHESARTNTQNLQKLAFGRIDYIVIDYAVALNLITHDLPQLADKVEPIYPPLGYQSIYLACNANTPKGIDIIKRFNASLKVLWNNGKLTSLAEKYGLDDLSIDSAQQEVLQ